MISSIKFIIIIVLLVCVMIWYCKSKKNTLNIIAIVISVLVLVSLLNSDFEKKLVRYDSPEEAFQQVTTDSSITKILKTDNSAFILYKSGSDNSYMYLDNVNGKWKIPFKNDNYASTHLGVGGILSIYKETSTNNYYVALIVNTNDDEIIDSKNQVFEECNTRQSFAFFRYFVAFIEDVDENYYININNQKIYLKDLILKI